MTIRNVFMSYHMHVSRCYDTLKHILKGNAIKRVPVHTGNSCHAAEPGFFRICYAIVDNDTILQLVDRLVGFISKSQADRQQMPLWISRASMQKAQQQIENDPALPEAPVQH